MGGPGGGWGGRRIIGHVVCGYLCPLFCLLADLTAVFLCLLLQAFDENNTKCAHRHYASTAQQGWFIFEMKWVTLVAKLAMHLQDLYMQTYKPHAPPCTYTLTEMMDTHSLSMSCYLLDN